YREAIRLRPDYASAHYNLGLALRGKQDLDGAVVAFQEAIRLQPDFAYAHNNLGHTLMKKQDWDGAIACFRAARRFDPAIPNHTTIIGAFRSKGEEGGLLADAREQLRLNPDDADAYYELGIALRRKGDADGAVAAWRDALRVCADRLRANPNDWRAYLLQS